ncbi:RraA family protein [Streptomyces antimycoticus]|uniref:hypothetical protein n=1 Tax=Streptomyces antimycoticus TaxID=68175 RepID=UPI00368E525E
MVRADADGVVVVRRENVPDVIRTSRARVEAEDAYIADYRVGESVIEASRPAEVLEAKGLVVDA